MAGERKYTRIPPESTGDRVYMIHTAEINYDGKDPAHVWQIGERYTITGNGGDTFTVHVHGVYEATSTTGRLAVHYNQEAKEKGWVVSDDQSIQYDTDDDDVLETVATVNTDAYDIYIPAQNIMGYDNPEYGWDIDRFGSGQVTFADGAPELTAFGKLRVNEPRLLANYDFTNSELKTQFANSREGDGVTLTWEEDNGQVKLFNPATASTRVTHTSNLFHAHINGSGSLFVFGARTGDSGKANVVRNWGPFDAYDGFFFQLNGTSLRVVHRYTLEGNATANHVVEQADWNKDTLDGTSGASNPSGMNLDLTKSNIYWVDYQFMSGGRTRFGVYYQGQRIVCHEIIGENGNGMIQNTNALRNPNRPLCWAQATTAGVPASSSEFFALGGSVYLEATVDPLVTAQQYSRAFSSKVFAKPQEQKFTRTYQSDGDPPADAAVQSSYSSDTSTQYLFTISPKQFYTDATTGQQGTIENHSVYQPLKFYVSSFDATTGNPRPIQMRVFAKCIMRGFNWRSGGVSAPTIDYDQSGDHLAHGPEIARFWVNGDGVVEFSSSEQAFQYNTVRNLSDQPFSRDLQPLSEFKTDDDKYSTGINAVKVKVKQHPIYGSNIHYFEDTQPVVISTGSGSFDFTGIFGGTESLKSSAPAGYASADYVTPGNESGWYYLALLGNNDAWLYESLANLDDDRTVRIITVDAIGTTAVGDTLTVTSGAASGATATIIDTTATTLTVVGRSLATGDAAAATVSSLDVGLTSGSFDTTTGGASVGTISSVALSTSSDLKDYWTSLLAVRKSDLGLSVTETLTNPDLSLYGNAPPRQAWTFMAGNITDTAADEDGDTGPALNNSLVKTTVVWRERTQ